MKVADYDAIIFDLGGVLWNISYKNTSEQFKKIGFEEFDKWYSQAKQLHLFDDLEKGLIAKDEFISSVKKIINKSVSEKQIIDAWNAMLLDLPIHRIAFLKQVKEQKPIYLLSNTNEIHLIELEKRCEQTEVNWQSFMALFNKPYFSCRIGMRKPDEEIFEFVLKENNLKPHSTLFIDDSIQHIESAKKLNIQTLFLHEETDISQMLKIE